MNHLMRYFVLVSCIVFLGCNSSQNPEEVSGNDTVIEEKIVDESPVLDLSLKTVLDEKKANFEQKASDFKKSKYAEGIQFVIDSKIVENALQIGDVAPNFTLKNATNTPVSLYDQLEAGPVILMWYRGGWCPYCNITLHHMQESLATFKKYGASLLALTPELPDSSMSTIDKNDLEFQVLSDLNNSVANQYKVVFKLTTAVGDLYEKGFGLSNYNGNNKRELPLAATYIIGQDRMIKYAFLDADYRNRAEPEELISVLKQM